MAAPDEGAPRAVSGTAKRRSFLGRLPGLFLALQLAGCATAAPPEPPPPMEVPAFGEWTIDLTDSHGGALLSPPPMTEDERRDPILGSTVAEDPDVRERVNYWILRWQTWGQGYFTRYLERMERYAGLVDREIAERGLPPSLRYLPVVESGYNPVAVSPAGAAGMWQFMPATARFLGMDVTPLIDERRDPWTSTGAALDYLAELNERFEGSWFLALAAYNGGWGRVQRTLDRYGNGAEPSDSLFWALRDRFPRETRDFVPKLLAAARLARNPEVYGFVPDIPPVADAPREVRVPDATSLDVVADAAGVDLEEVERLNPHLLRGYTPPDRETALRVPGETVERFRTRYAAIPPEERVSFVEHRIRPGETLTHVADRYRVPLSEIRAANPRVRPRRLQVGQWVVVPRSPRATDASTTTGRVASTASSGGSGPSASSGTGAGGRGGGALSEGEDADAGEVVHRVSSGESLWTIARRYGVRVADVRRWNELSAGAVLHPGDELRIRGESVALYRVQRGDTLSDIALRHGVPTETLLRVNGLGRGSVIRPGDEVRIPQ